MPDTHGFEVVAEVGIEVLRQFLRAAWENGGTADEGAIPHEVVIEPGLNFGPYTVDHGQVQIPQDGLSLDMVPSINGVTVELATAIQVAMDPSTVPLPSLTLFDMTADISVTAPVGIIPGTDYNVGVIFEGLPRSGVDVSLTSGDPIGSITTEMIAEYVHARWEEGLIPHTLTEEAISYGAFTADAFLETFDDPSDTTHQITVTEPAADQLKISIPVHLRLSNMTAAIGPAPLSPMGVLARIAITVPLVSGTGSITAQLSAATVEVEKFDGTPCIPGDPCADPAVELCLMGAPDDGEAANYQLNKQGGCLFGLDLESLLTTNLRSRGQDMANALGDINVTLPNVADIEAFIGDQVHAELLRRRFMGAWTPQTPDGSHVEIDEVRPKVLPAALAIAINPVNGADENALSNFIPAAQAFAITLDGAFVEQTIGEIVARPEEEGGFGGIPREFSDIEGYRCTVTSMNWDLRDGAIRFSGDVTVHDVFCGADADCSFWANIGLRWTDPDVEGRQILEPYLIDHDVDLPWWAWLIAVLSFLIGVIIGIVWVVITAVIDNIAESVGGAVMEDEVSGHLQALGAWPQELQGIGTVTSTFRREVDIDSESVMFAGSILIIAAFYMTIRHPAAAGGPHIGVAGAPMSFFAGPPHPRIRYEWSFGDGGSDSGNEVNHTYADDGLYVLRLTTIVDEPGGATTHHSVWVRVLNAAPVVSAGSDREIDEGESATYIGSLSDQEWSDTHEATWDFGDDALPVEATIVETNEPPQASGSVSADHAYGDDGVYDATLTVRDDDGGIGRDSARITVRNVPPAVEAGPDRYAYVGFPVRLIAQFTDPGWLDTHTGSWSLGDCSPQQMAVISEQNEPPLGQGESSVSHVYRRCGDYHILATVVDDDGGVGQDEFVLHVVELVNATFEAGYRHTMYGVVANGWEPYSLPYTDITGTSMALPAAAPFAAEEFVVHQGQRSQKVSHNGPFRAGIYQQLGANPGWHYEVLGFYHLVNGVGTHARLGLDPRGGTDPRAAQVLWVASGPGPAWDNLTSRIEAAGDRITIFLEILHGAGISTGHSTGASATANVESLALGYFDRVSMIPYQSICPEQLCEPTCADFSGMQPGLEMSEPFVHEQITFTPLGEKVRTATFGDPAGQVKLAFPSKGVRMDFPQKVDEVQLSVNNYAGRELQFAVYDGTTLIEAFTEIIDNEVREVSIVKPAITAVSIGGGKDEAAIVKVCLCLPEALPEPGCEETCIDFDQLPLDEALNQAFTHGGLRFTPQGDYGCRVASWGKPKDRQKLVFPSKGIRITLPHPVDEAQLMVNNYYGSELEFNVFAGSSLVQHFVESLQHDVKTVTITQAGLTTIEIQGGGNEAAVVEICVCLQDLPMRAASHKTKYRNQGYRKR